MNFLILLDRSVLSIYCKFLISSEYLIPLSCCFVLNSDNIYPYFLELPTHRKYFDILKICKRYFLRFDANINSLLLNVQNWLDITCALPRVWGHVNQATVGKDGSCKGGVLYCPLRHLGGEGIINYTAAPRVIFCSLLQYTGHDYN